MIRCLLIMRLSHFVRLNWLLIFKTNNHFYTLRSQINSHKIVVKIQNGSKALLLSKDELHCQTSGPKIYKRPMQPKKKTFRIFSQVTIKLQYANEIDSDCSQSFILFKLRNTLKNGVEAKWKVLSHVLFKTSKIFGESIGVIGTN